MITLQKNRFINKLFSIAKKWKSVLVLLPYKFLPAHARLSHIGSAFRGSRLLYLAVQLDIADLLANQNVTVEHIAKKQSLNRDNLYRILRALVSMGIFTEVSPKVFANNRLSKLLLRSNKYNVRQDILLDNQASKSAVWFDNDESQKGVSNRPSSKDLRRGTSEHLNIDTKVNTFEGFDWSSFDLVFDSGNANGDHILDILRSTSDLNICIYDNSAAIRSAKMFWQGDHIKDTNIRLSFEQGDMFTSLPKASSQHNLYCFVRVFSGLSDRDGLTILRNAKVAIANFNATIAIVDTVLPIEGLDPSDALDDIQLLLGNSGEHRTLKQWEILIKQTDFTLAEVAELRSSNKILVLRKT